MKKGEKIPNEYPKLFSQRETSTAVAKNDKKYNQQSTKHHIEN